MCLAHVIKDSQTIYNLLILLWRKHVSLSHGNAYYYWGLEMWVKDTYQHTRASGWQLKEQASLPTRHTDLWYACHSENFESTPISAGWYIISGCILNILNGWHKTHYSDSVYQSSLVGDSLLKRPWMRMRGEREISATCLRLVNSCSFLVILIFDHIAHPIFHLTSSATPQLAFRQTWWVNVPGLVENPLFAY